MRTMLITGTALLCMLSTIAQADKEPLKPIPAGQAIVAPRICPLWPVAFDGMQYYYFAYSYNELCEEETPTYIWGNVPEAPLYPCSENCLGGNDKNQKAANDKEKEAAGTRDLALRATLRADGDFNRLKDSLPRHFEINTGPAEAMFKVRFDHNGDGNADKVVRLYQDVIIFPRAACRAAGHSKCDQIADTKLICFGFECTGTPKHVVPNKDVQDITQSGDGEKSKFRITIDGKKYVVFLKNL